jgi:hypothetical protein
MTKIGCLAVHHLKIDRPEVHRLKTDPSEVHRLKSLKNRRKIHQMTMKMMMKKTVDIPLHRTTHQMGKPPLRKPWELAPDMDMEPQW